MDIQGPAGILEAQFDTAADAQGTVAVLCHPHPQYGGSMYDGVLQTAAEVLLESGVDCLRFNFRGVGGSAGSFDNGVGEAEDLLAVADWVSDAYEGCPQWWLGYSFGAAMVWRALQSAPSIQPGRAILIAPPVGMLDFSGAPPNLSIDAVAGDRDDFVDSAKLQALDGVAANIIPGADHFFSGYHAQLAQALRTIVR